MRSINANSVIAIAALVTSVAAVWVSWSEARLLRESQEASFRPIIETMITTKTSQDTLSIALALRNSGHGVAFVEDVSMSVGGQPVTDWESFYGPLFPDDLRQDVDLNWSSATGFFQPGESKGILLMHWPATPDNVARFESFLREDASERMEALDVTTCYCSVFDQCWKREIGLTEKPTRTDECEGQGDPIEALWTSFLRTEDDT
ncbi:MAG: hypothetical protein AAGA39_01595 [Pseudomonadota bacterium]